VITNGKIFKVIIFWDYMSEGTYSDAKFVDVFSNRRTAIVVPEGKDKLRVGIDRYIKECVDYPFLLPLLRPVGSKIIFLDHKKKYPTTYRCSCECRDWAFDKVGLSHYTLREGWFCANELISRDFSDIRWTPKPEENSVVMYSDGGSRVLHWGVVEDVEDDISVNSKWGRGHVYNHPLWSIPSSYGDYAVFFEVLN